MRDKAPYTMNISRFQGGSGAKCRHIKDCYYRSRDGVSCDYILKTGHRRGCSPRHCRRYTPKNGAEE